MAQKLIMPWPLDPETLFVLRGVGGGECPCYDRALTAAQGGQGLEHSLRLVEAQLCWECGFEMLIIPVVPVSVQIG